MRNSRTASAVHSTIASLLVFASALSAGCSDKDSAKTATVTRPFLYKDQEGKTTAAEFVKADLQPAQVSDLAENQDLMSLTFYECTGLNKAFLNELIKLDRLTELHLIRCHIDQFAFKELSKLPRLTSLTLSHLEVGEEDLAALERCERLRSLTLTGEIAETALPGLAAVSQIESLEIATEDFQLASISELSLPELRSLSLPNNELSDDELRTMPARPKLQRIQFPAGKVSDAGLTALARFPALVQLDLSGSKVTPRGLQVLTSFPGLEELTLYNCKQVTNEAVPILARLNKLKRLQLEKSGVSGTGLGDLAASTSLNYVGIGETQATLEETEALSKMLPMCQVDRIRELP